MKTQVWKHVVFAFALSGVCLLSACKKDYTGKEEQSPLFKKAEQNKQARKYADAVRDYEEFLMTSPKSGKAHQRLAELYKDSVNDPVMAIYHYNRYQSLSALSQDDKRSIAAMIRLCNEKYYSRLQQEMGPSQQELEDLEKLNNKISQKDNEIAALKARIVEDNKKKEEMLKQINTYREKLGSRAGNAGSTASGRSSSGSGSVQPHQNGQQTAAGAGITGRYKVAKGDTLTKISKKVYGSGNYVNKIREANREKIGQKDRIMIGMELVIPPK